MNAKTETLTYAFGCEAGLRRLKGCLPPLEVVYPPLVAQRAEEQGKKLPHIENPCTDDGLGILIVRSLLMQEMRLRLEAFAQRRIPNLTIYNAKTPVPLPRICIVIAGLDDWRTKSVLMFRRAVDRLLSLGRAAGFSLSPFGEGRDGGGVLGMYDRYKRGSVSREAMMTSLVEAHTAQAVTEKDYKRMMDDVLADVYLDEKLIWDDECANSDKANEKGIVL